MFVPCFTNTSGNPNNSKCDQVSFRISKISLTKLLAYKNNNQIKTDIKLNKPSSRFLFPFPFPFPASLSWSLSFSCFFFSSSFLACASRYPSGYYVNLQSYTSFLKQRDHLKVERTGQRFCTNFGSRIIYHSGQIK